MLWLFFDASQFFFFFFCLWFVLFCYSVLIVNKRERRAMKELGLLFMIMFVLELFTNWVWCNLFERTFF